MRWLLIVCVCLVVGCEYDHRFKRGDIVEMKIDKRRGMVLSAATLNKQVLVRFAGEVNSTDTPLFGGKKPITGVPYATMRVSEFELDPVPETAQVSNLKSEISNPVESSINECEF